MKVQNQPSSLDDTIAELRRSKRRGLIVSLTVAAWCCALLFAWPLHARNVRAYVNGEADLSGAPRFSPDRGMSDYARGAIDFEELHREVIPAWTVGLAQAAQSGRRYWADRADDRFATLAAAVEPDPNLSDLLRQTHEALRHDPVGRADRVDYWLWAYNRYLDDSHIPWRLEASLALRDANSAVLITRSYEVLADARTPTGERLRLMRRADRLGIVAGWLGRTGRNGDGAMVLMRRVLHFTVRHIWPAMHPALDRRRPRRERTWLPAVREELQAALPQATLDLLRETAVDQQALIEVAEEIEARQRCGSRFRLAGLSYNGLSRRNARAIQNALVRSRGNSECPEVTLDEAARIVGASERLARTVGLEDAIERLTMVVARSVAVHELRHAADGDDLDEIECPGCPERVEGLARAEVSAYLSAMSTEGLGYLALFQACATPSGRSIQGAARQSVLSTLLPYGCEGPPLHGLYAAATDLEHQLFGARRPVVLPALPDRVQLLPRGHRTAAVPRATALASGWGLRLRPTD